MVGSIRPPHDVVATHSDESQGSYLAQWRRPKEGLLGFCDYLVVLGHDGGEAVLRYEGDDAETRLRNDWARLKNDAGISLHRLLWTELIQGRAGVRREGTEFRKFLY